MKRFFLISLIAMSALCCKSQDIVLTEDDTELGNKVKLVAEVKAIDSEYYLITHLTAETDTSFQTDKSRFFRNGNLQVSGQYSFYIQKAIRGAYVNLSVDMLMHPLYDGDWGTQITVDKAHPVSDTIRLSLFVPLEKAEYRIAATMTYYCKGQPHFVYSEFIDFNVLFIPPRSIF